MTSVMACSCSRVFYTMRLGFGFRPSPARSACGHNRESFISPGPAPVVVGVGKPFIVLTRRDDGGAAVLRRLQPAVVSLSCRVASEIRYLASTHCRTDGLRPASAPRPLLRTAANLPPTTPRTACVRRLGRVLREASKNRITSSESRRVAGQSDAEMNVCMCVNDLARRTIS